VSAHTAQTKHITVASPTSIRKLNDVIVVAAVETNGQFVKCDALRFLRVTPGFFDLPDQVRMHIRLLI
jgi:hypothetical protein